MLDIITIVQLVVASNLLIQPAMWSALDSLPPANSGMFQVVAYNTILSCHDRISVSIGGDCYLGDPRMECEQLGLGQRTL